MPTELLCLTEQPAAPDASSVATTGMCESPPCVALTVRMWGPKPKKADPAFVKQAVALACRHNEIVLYDVPERLQTRNDHRQYAIWRLQEAVRKYDRHQRCWYHYRHGSRTWTGCREPKPCTTTKECLLDLRLALDYYTEWE